MIDFIAISFTALALQAQTAEKIVQNADEKMRGNTSQAETAIKIVRPSWRMVSVPAILCNRKGLHECLSEERNIAFEASPRNLMPAKYGVLINSSRNSLHVSMEV